MKKYGRVLSYLVSGPGKNPVTWKPFTIKLIKKPQKIQYQVFFEPIQNRVSPSSEHLEAAYLEYSKQTLKNINENSKRVAPFSIVRFSGNSNSKIPATFQMRKVRQNSYRLSKFPLRILADWETNIYAEAVFKVRSATPAWLGQVGWEHHVEFEENCWERQLK